MDVTVGPDRSQCDRATAPRRPSELPSREGFCVVDEATWRAMLAHAASRLDVEVGGILLGEVCVDEDDGSYLSIDGHVPALAAPSGSTSVSFTADAWAQIHDTIDRERPGARIVGWYHTHPGFGIFLSPMDVFIQRNFFDQPYQVAVVIDPRANASGAFVWHAGEPTREAILVRGGARAHVPMPAPVVAPPRMTWKLSIALLIAAAIVAAALLLTPPAR